LQWKLTANAFAYKRRVHARAETRSSLQLGTCRKYADQLRLMLRPGKLSAEGKGITS